MLFTCTCTSGKDFKAEQRNKQNTLTDSPTQENFIIHCKKKKYYNVGIFSIKKRGMTENSLNHRENN